MLDAGGGLFSVLRTDASHVGMVCAQGICMRMSIMARQRGQTASRPSLHVDYHHVILPEPLSMRGRDILWTTPPDRTGDRLQP